MNDDKPVKATTIDLLRRIDPKAWATIEEPNGWAYSTNIGHLAHRAADEISILTNNEPSGRQAAFLNGVVVGAFFVLVIGGILMNNFIVTYCLPVTG